MSSGSKKKKTKKSEKKKKPSYHPDAIYRQDSDRIAAEKFHKEWTSPNPSRETILQMHNYPIIPKKVLERNAERKRLLKPVAERRAAAPDDFWEALKNEAERVKKKASAQYKKTQANGKNARGK